MRRKPTRFPSGLTTGCSVLGGPAAPTCRQMNSRGGRILIIGIETSGAECNLIAIGRKLPGREDECVPRAVTFF